jgi:hypothetical protein
MEGVQYKLYYHNIKRRPIENLAFFFTISNGNPNYKN